MELVTVQAIIKAPINKVWEYWTNPAHIVHWNFASADWHCPNATNNLEISGEFHYLMAAKDGSVSFDFGGTYQAIEINKQIDILLGDGRKMEVSFEETTEGTQLTERFEPETMNAVELQKTGWQLILDNFKSYVDKN
ncbi:MAG: SRPBCC domain-containing protein [Bacteroidota bacterium]|nr:SRPBCC domain-containing protein [Bacteroidota bacterium]